jgi:cytochrome c oxidase subunit 2
MTTSSADVSLWTGAASTTAQQVDMLFFFMLTVCGAVGSLVAVLLIYFCIRYRRRPGEVGNPPPTHQSRLLEWFWTLSPLGVFAIAFVWGSQIYFSAYNAPDDATPVYVVAKQWMWKFQHPEGQREISTLHVPVGRPIKLLLISEDVIHSFFVPAFRIHMDVLPQRFTSVWFQATKPGTFHLFCSQYCGTSHATMTGQVIAMEPADYQRWLGTSAEGSLALQGRQVFLKYRCLSCHSADSAARAPVLEDLYDQPVALNDGTTVIADRDYILQSILQPSDKIVMGYQDIMPSFLGQVTMEDAVALIAFIQSLKPGDTPRRVEDFPPPNKNPVIEPDDTTKTKDTTP